METSTDQAAFPILSKAEITALRLLATAQSLADGQTAFKAGDADIDLVVVESGRLNILNPADGNRVIATHGAGAFAGDIDIITRRPVIVTAMAEGPTHILRVPGANLRELLNRVPGLGEKLMTAFTLRRSQLSDSGILGFIVTGPGRCRETGLVREFLHKNFVPFTWFDSNTDEGKRRMAAAGSPSKTPVVECGNGEVLIDPPLVDLARAAGLWRECPNQSVDLAVIGAGPAGMTAAVYAASEGLSTIVFDRVGPGGQASASSRIENFIGFPAGLSGSELATRGTLQMLKFGARLAVPVSVGKMIPAEAPGRGTTLQLDCGATVKAGVVLLAAGVKWRKLAAEGADRFERAGVYYACTSVEAILFDKCDVAVVGAGNSAGQAAMFLAECCPNRKVHMIVRNKLGSSISEYLASRIRSASNIIVHEGTEVSRVFGNATVNRIEIKERQSGVSTFSCDAVFVFIGAEPRSDWLPNTIARDPLGYILTGVDAARSGKWPLKNRDPYALETTIPGVLAGGDIRSGSTKRVGFAVGDGSLAVTCAHRLLSVAP